MAKYKKYDNSGELLFSFQNGLYNVYKLPPGISIYVLVKNGYIVAEKYAVSDKTPIDKKFTLNWIKHFEKTTKKRLSNIQDQINDLLKEEKEIKNILDK